MVITEKRTDQPVLRRRLTPRHILTGALWVLVALFAIWAAVRLMGLESGYPTVQLLAFTPYVAASSLLPLLAAVMTKRVWPAVAAAIVVLALAACVVPRWLADLDTGPAKSGGPTLRVLSVNLRLGGGEPDTIVGLVRAHRVDLVALQEYTPQASSALERAGLRDLLPNRVAYPVDGVGGSALYSRFPLIDGGFRVHGSGFGQAMATLTVPGAAPVQVESVHPCAPSDASRSRCWREDLADQPSATVSGPVRLLIGDFNATLDHAALRHLIATGYRDAADVVGAGFTQTWPYDRKWYFPKITIDHVLADRRVGVKDVTAATIPRSDHRALFATLQLPPG